MVRTPACGWVSNIVTCQQGLSARGPDTHVRFQCARGPHILNCPPTCYAILYFCVQPGDVPKSAISQASGSGGVGKVPS